MVIWKLKKNTTNISLLQKIWLSSESCGAVEMVIPWQLCQTIGPLMFHGQETWEAAIYSHKFFKTSLKNNTQYKDQTNLVSRLKVMFNQDSFQ